jgi:hypothetical protein
VALSAPGSAFDDITQDPSSPYYIGPVGSEVSSGDDIRAEVSKQVDDDIAHGWLGDVVTPLQRDQEIQKRYEQQISNARSGLDNGLELRANGTAPSTVWDNATHQQMIDSITQDADPAAVAVTSEQWVSLGNELTDHQQNLADAISDSMSDWQGAGGDAARRHLANVGQWLGTTAKGATLTGRQQEIHSQALNETQKQMAANPPVQFDVQAANAHLQTITDPVVYAQQAQLDQEALRQQEAARQQAARIMSQYDETVGSATSTPAFPPPPKLAGLTARTATLPSGSASGGGAEQASLRSGTQLPGGADGAADGNALGGGGAGMPGGGIGAGAGAGGGSFGSGANAPALSGGGIPGGLPLSASAGGGAGGGGLNTPELSGVDSPSGGSPSGSIPDLPDSTLPSSVTGTDLSSATAGSAKLPTIGYSGGINGDSIASRLGGTAGPTGNPLAGLDSLGGSSGLGGVSGLGGIGGVGGGSLGGAGSLKGIGGLGAGEGGAGSLKGIGGLGSSEGGAGGVKGVSGLGGGGGAGGGKLAAGASSGAAAAAEEAAAGRGGAGAAGTAGRNGTAGAGMGHGGRGKGEEDKEHRLADYLEGEPDLFEAGQVVAPPVIGDWKKAKEDKKK